MGLLSIVQHDHYVLWKANVRPVEARGSEVDLSFSVYCPWSEQLEPEVLDEHWWSCCWSPKATQACDLASLVAPTKPDDQLSDFDEMTNANDETGETGEAGEAGEIDELVVVGTADEIGRAGGLEWGCGERCGTGCGREDWRRSAPCSAPSSAARAG